MSDDLSPALRQTLLDDFSSEADEHLSAIRHALTELDGSMGPPAPSILNTLFASFHSFKGISAFAGLGPAEKLAHVAEDYLRLLTDEKQELTKAGLDALFLCAHQLDKIVTAHRQQQPAPVSNTALEELQKLILPKKGVKTKTSTGPLLKPPSAAPAIADARHRGLLIWRCIYLPRGRTTNINQVRERLGALGEILDSEPRVAADKKIEFHFLLGLREPPGDLLAWESDGIRFELTSKSPAPDDEPWTAANDPPSPHDPFVAPSRMVRVDMGRLDDLMRVMGDLVIHRARLEDQVNALRLQQDDNKTEALKDTSTGITRSLKDLREAIMRVRLVPVAQLFERMPFIVRDLASDTGKKIHVQFTGQKTEIDKFIIERLKDALLHLVRNAVSHGIEEPEEREKTCKEPEAIISLSAETQGKFVIIRIADDGRGIDIKRVLNRAAAEGFFVSEKPNTTELLNHLCRPGLSTRDQADRASGRGVGMGVAHDAVREIGGSLTLETERNKGTTFTLRVPLTLAIIDVFIIKVGPNTYAVPQSSISEVIELDPAGLRSAGQAELLHYRSGVLPLVRLANLFRTPSAGVDEHVLVLETEHGQAGIVVDRVINQREVVVRALGDPLAHAEGFAGATELGDGRPVLILDVAAITKGAFRPRGREKPLQKSVSKLV